MFGFGGIWCINYPTLCSMATDAVCQCLRFSIQLLLIAKSISRGAPCHFKIDFFAMFCFPFFDSIFYFFAKPLKIGKSSARAHMVKVTAA